MNNNDKVYNLNRRRQKKIIRSRNSKIFTFFAIIFFYLFFTSIFFNTKSVENNRVLREKMENTITSEALIIRDEIVLKSEAEGIITHYFQETDKVKKGDVIASVIDEDIYDINRSHVEEIEKDILKKQARRDGIFLFNNELNDLNANIDKKIKNYFGKTFNSNNLKEAVGLKRHLENYISDKLNIYTFENKGSIKPLIKKYKFLNNKLESEYKNVLAPRGGILLYDFDGFENKYNFNDVNSVSIDDIKSTNSTSTITNLNKITYGDPICKVVNNFKWYLATVVDNKLAKDLKVGDTKKIRVSDAVVNVFNANIVRVDRKDKGTIVVLEANSNIEDFLTSRKVKIDIIQKSYEGYKIQKKAIVYKTFFKIPNKYIINSQNTRGIIKKENNEEKFFPVDVLYNDTFYTYVYTDFEKFSLNDEILYKKDNTYETYSLNTVEKPGVYLSDTNFADFKRVEIILEKDDYILAKMNIKNSINLYDSYILDAKYSVDGANIK